MTKELIKRAVQHLLSSFIFDAPILVSIKMAILKTFFDIGEDSYISYNAILYSPHTTKHARLKIGKKVGVEHGCDIDYSGGLTIGDHTWVSEGVFISTHKHEVGKRTLKKKQKTVFSPLEIGEDAWLGAGSIILSGVGKIGKGAVIGAGAIVTKDVDDWTIVAGNPARPIGKRGN